MQYCLIIMVLLCYYCVIIVFVLYGYYVIVLLLRYYDMRNIWLLYDEYGIMMRSLRYYCVINM